MRVILWRDYNGITHAVRQSAYHPDDWDPICNTRPPMFGTHDIEKITASIRRAAVVPVEGPVTCLKCAIRYIG